jgi:opacity protein-like surface antigen
MKRLILAFFCIVFSSLTLSARAQVVPAATGRIFSLNAGGLGSVFQPDYAGEGVAQTSPNRLYGVGAYVDAHFSRWVQIEAEGRWSRFNQYYPFGSPPGNSEDTYLIGPRVPILTFHRLTPYGKFLAGLGGGDFLTGNTFVMAYGGGVDYRLSRRFTLRAFDFEYQQWRVKPTLYPYGGSVGLSYKIF